MSSGIVLLIVVVVILVIIAYLIGILTVSYTHLTLPTKRRV